MKSAHYSFQQSCLQNDRQTDKWTIITSALLSEVTREWIKRNSSIQDTWCTQSVSVHLGTVRDNVNVVSWRIVPCSCCWCSVKTACAVQSRLVQHHLKCNSQRRPTSFGISTYCSTSSSSSVQFIPFVTSLDCAVEQLA